MALTTATTDSGTTAAYDGRPFENTWYSWSNTTSTVGVGCVWYSWNFLANATITGNQIADATITATQISGSAGISNEERIQNEKREENRERVRLEELAREKKAEDRALELLLENLTENQKEIYRLTGAIPVECQSGSRYSIRKGTAGNVHELDEKGATKRRLCFHPSGCPVYDVMLAQKLLLETCEDDALRIANFH